jgi:rhodanese-related sulfurtransferase
MPSVLLYAAAPVPARNLTRSGAACPPGQFGVARIEGSKLVPMGEVPERLSELDPGAETVVICHHGARSAAVTRFLDGSGFSRTYNLTGGLDAYSDVDPGVPRY